MITTVWYFQLFPNCDATGKFSTNGRTREVRNQFGAEEHMSKNQKTRTQFGTGVSADTWKSTSAYYMINRHFRLLHQNSQIKKDRLSLYCTYTH